MNDRRCNNCKYFLKKFIEEPCVECIKKSGLEKWEPAEEMQIKEEKNCETCRHKQVNLDLEPCVRCVNGDGYEIRWEPNEQEQGLEKGCLRCRHFHTDVKEEPCKTCIESENFTKWEPNGMQIKLRKRPQILPEPQPIYEHTDSEIPERIRISFTNGTTAVYSLHVDQPKPLVMESIRIIRKWRSEGYQYVPPRRRRSRK